MLVIQMKRIILCIGLLIGISGILINNGPKVDEVKIIDEKRSIFISYIELNKYLNNRSVEEAKENIKKIVNNVYDLGFNEIILQVRSFSDAIYKSEIYPWSRYVSTSEGVDPGYDILEEFIKQSKDKEMNVIAWINPYRIRNSEDISDISHISPAYTYLDSDIVYIKNGIYFNPSKSEATELIVKGVEEILKKYKVGGILFDDYFYPDDEIDRKDYELYLKNNKYIPKDEYNLNVVSEMIKKVHNVCEKYNVLFGISPDGNMENNYNKVYADVKEWCGSNKYIDFIMPQIYYGFFNESKAFKKVSEEWENIILDESVKLRVALAFYKNGSIDKWAKSGKEEWLLNDDIIMREIIVSRNLNNYEGFSLFRYDYIFNDENYTEMTLKEIENMKKILN